MKIIENLKKTRSQIYFLACSFMMASATNAQAGWLDSAKQVAIDASEPVGLVVIMIGGMRISTKDLYGGIAAVVGGIFIFKAQDIASALK
ncbi:MAG: hypothetical protein PHV34_19175 [Verrucomicrobiae bacterium]|nr:hypothetical protein [Verrucomicrobiae bacterium]